MFSEKYFKLVLIASLLINILSLFYISNPESVHILQSISRNQPSNKLDLRTEFFKSSRFITKDYVFYNCNDSRRIGGVSKPNNKQKRVEGSWFVCFDRSLAPVANKCNVLSFGIDTDESFDLEMNRDYGCIVHSFDPFIESGRFTQIRNKNQSLKNSFLIPVNDKWKFYRIGVTGSNANIINKNQIGWIETLENIIQITGLKDKVIDVFKIDIEGAEISVLENFNIDYACKYYKQFVIETHAPSLTKNLYVLMDKLNKCFSLFRRDVRLLGPNYSGEYIEEIVNGDFNLNLKFFGNEINLVNFLLSTGELYFINENFI